MHESETKRAKIERFYRLLDRIISEVALGRDSPSQALIDQLDKSFKARS